jgi:hypothetical protein
MKMTFYQHLVLGLKMNGLIRPLLLYTFMTFIGTIIVMKCLQTWLTIS